MRTCRPTQNALDLFRLLISALGNPDFGFNVTRCPVFYAQSIHLKLSNGSAKLSRELRTQSVVVRVSNGAKRLQRCVLAQGRTKAAISRSDQFIRLLIASSQCERQRDCKDSRIGSSSIPQNGIVFE